MVTVGSLDYSSGQEKLSSFSIFAQSEHAPFLCTAGSELLTAAPRTKHAVSNGTSLAAPMVAGARALLMDGFPQWKNKPEVYIDLLLRSARINPQLEQKGGRGFLDIQAALAEAKTEQLFDIIQSQILKLKIFDLEEPKLRVERETANFGFQQAYLDKFLDIQTLLPLLIIRGNTLSIEKILDFNKIVANQKIKDLRYSSLLSPCPTAKDILSLELAILSGHGQVVGLLLQQEALPAI